MEAEAIVGRLVRGSPGSVFAGYKSGLPFLFASGDSIQPDHVEEAVELLTNLSSSSPSQLLQMLPILPSPLESAELLQHSISNLLQEGLQVFMLPI